MLDTAGNHGYFWAFLLAPLWLLFRRLWLVFVLYVLVTLATDGLLETDSGDEYLSSLLHMLRLGTTDDLEVLADDLLRAPRQRDS